jgi:peptidoglycan/LPS O-acetylase OafA/YrhL
VSLRRNRGIEGIRGLAAFAVILTHVGTVMAVDHPETESVLNQAGDQVLLLLGHGVTVFFVLSGYLLYRPFAVHLLRGDRAPSPATFYRNRALRIMPAYLVILLVSGWVLGSVFVSRWPPGVEADRHSYLEKTGYLTDPLQLLLNATLTQGYSWSTHVPSAISPAWSLVPEVAFYALLPLVWLLARRLTGDTPSVRAALVPPVLLVVVGLVGFEVSAFLVATVGDGVVFAASWPSMLFHTLLATCELFGFGMLVAVLVSLLGDTPDPARLARARRTAVLLVVACAVLYLPLRLVLQDRLVVGIAASAAIFLTVAPGGGRVQRGWTRFLDSAPMEHAGVISYSVYLWHYPLALFLLREVPGLGFSTLGGFLVALLVVTAATLVMSEITYRLVEKPALERKRSMVDAGAGAEAHVLQRTPDLTD